MCVGVLWRTANTKEMQNEDAQNDNLLLAHRKRNPRKKSSSAIGPKIMT